MTDAKNPFEGQKTFEYASEHGRVMYTPRIAWSFLQHLLASKRLPIKEAMKQFDRIETFFLIAGTGLGKTVAMPVYLWFRQMHFVRYYPDAKPGGIIREDEAPRVWVVEPKIAIVQGLWSELNAEWDRWWLTKKAKTPAPLFGCKTKVDHRNIRAPIMFITTGIFSIYARKGVFKPGRDIILMDEAHETLETDDAVELAVGICRAASVAVQYMSATVDAKELPERLGVTVVDIPGKRYPVWRHNTGLPMEDCVEELVENALVEQNCDSQFFPKDRGDVSQQIVSAVTEQGRAKGMLIIVNSFSSEQSDAKRIARQLKQAPFARQIEIGLLASEVLRDPRRRAAYHQMLERWKREKARYVLIATSVVEMGVTLPDLDFIVTMDSGFADAGEHGKLERVALGTNALIQRFGRVGRVRPGIAYITREVGAPYTNLDDIALNADGALTPQPIAFPMSTGTLTWLAYETFVRGWHHANLEAAVATLKLPTPITNDPERFSQLCSERFRLWQLGVKYENQGDVGRYLERWIGRADLDWALEARRALRKESPDAIMNALCSCVLSALPVESVYTASEKTEQSVSADAATRILRVFALEVLRRRALDLEAQYSNHEILEYIWEVLIERDAREDLFLKQFVLLIEFLDVLREGCLEDSALKGRLETLAKWRDALRTFLKLES